MEKPFAKVFTGLPHYEMQRKSFAAEAVLPFDLMVAEILLRLPSASVFRCRAVCRAWRGITSSPGFVAAYARRRPLELIVVPTACWTPSRWRWATRRRRPAGASTPGTPGCFYSPTTTSATAGASGRRTTSARSRLLRPGGCRVRR
ncbi:uncharacterized protein [Miscanthus floridulus]|uniref:uncharacterized protein n=1 Tax=Miscanthus floridulus TaxID=154761 RepID=UPI003459BF76